MADVAQLNVALTESGTAHVISALGNVEKAVQQTDHSVISLGATMGATASVVTAALSTIANVAGGALASVGEAVIGMNSKLEQSSIAFTTMLGSAEASAAMLKDLQQFAATTPFEFPQLVDAAKKMMALGFSAQQVRPMLTSIGDAAAGLSIGAAGIDRITLALGQMQMKGKVSAEEVNQLAEAGINAWESIAKKIGVDVPTAMDMASKGMIKSTEAIPAILEGMTAKFGGMMEAQSHTFSGAVSTIKDTVGQLAAVGFKPFFDVISSMTDRLATFAQSETVSIWAEDLQITLGALTPMFSNFGAWLESTLPAAMSVAEAAAHAFVDAVQTVGPVLQNVANVAGPILATAWERLTTVLGAASEAFAAIAPVLGPVFSAVDSLSQAVNGVLGQALQGLIGQFGKLGETLGPVGEGFARLFASADPTAFDGLREAARVLGDGFSALGTLVDEKSQDLRIVLVEAVNFIIPKLEDLGTWLGATLPPFIATLQAAWSGFWDHAGPLLSAAWAIIQPALQGLAGFFGSELQVAIKGFQTLWDGIVGNLKSGLGFLAPILASLGGVSAEIADKITKGLEAIPSAMEAAQPKVASEAEETGRVAKNAVEKGFDAAEIAAGTEALGSEMMTGLMEGLATSSPAAQSAVRATIRSLIAAAKAEAEIASPSAVFAREIGIPITEGIAQGILSNSVILPAAIQQQIRMTAAAGAAAAEEGSGSERPGYVDPTRAATPAERANEPLLAAAYRGQQTPNVMTAASMPHEVQVTDPDLEAALVRAEEHNQAYMAQLEAANQARQAAENATPAVVSYSQSMPPQIAAARERELLTYRQATETWEQASARAARELLTTGIQLQALRPAGFTVQPGQEGGGNYVSPYSARPQTFSTPEQLNTYNNQLINLQAQQARQQEQAAVARRIAEYGNMYAGNYGIVTASSQAWPFRTGEDPTTLRNAAAYRAEHPDRPPEDTQAIREATEALRGLRISSVEAARQISAAYRSGGVEEVQALTGRLTEQASALMESQAQARQAAEEQRAQEFAATAATRNATVATEAYNRGLQSVNGVMQAVAVPNAVEQAGGWQGYVDKLSAAIEDAGTDSGERFTNAFGMTLTAGDINLRGALTEIEEQMIQEAGLHYDDLDAAGMESSRAYTDAFIAGVRDAGGDVETAVRELNERGIRTIESQEAAVRAAAESMAQAYTEPIATALQATGQYVGQAPSAGALEALSGMEAQYNAELLSGKGTGRAIYQLAPGQEPGIEAMRAMMRRTGQLVNGQQVPGEGASGYGSSGGGGGSGGSGATAALTHSANTASASLDGLARTSGEAANAAMGYAKGTSEASAQMKQMVQTAYGVAYALSSGADLLAAQRARVYATVLEETHNTEIAAAAAAAAASTMQNLNKQGQLLQQGMMALTQSMTIAKGLTYGQIYAGSPQGVVPGGGPETPGGTTLLPGNYYGVPVVSPITKGSLRGFADGGWVPEPVVGRGLRSGAGYSFGENGPEYVSPGGGGPTQVSIAIDARGMDPVVMKNAGFWDQAFSQGIRPAARRVGVRL
jgi:tape measure domain-containing protein